MSRNKEKERTITEIINQMLKDPSNTGGLYEYIVECQDDDKVKKYLVVIATGSREEVNIYHIESELKDGIKVIDLSSWSLCEVMEELSSRYRICRVAGYYRGYSYCKN